MKISIAQLIEHPENLALLPSQSKEELALLKARLQTDQEDVPFVVLQDPMGNRYLVLDGNTRLRLFRELGYAGKIECIIKDLVTAWPIEQQRTYIENTALARRNLSRDAKEQIAMRQVARGVKQADVARTLGMTQPWVSAKTQEVAEARKEARQEAVAELSEVGLSTREIGEIIKEDHSTVVRDMKKLVQNIKNDNLHQSDEVADPTTEMDGSGQPTPLPPLGQQAEVTKDIGEDTETNTSTATQEIKSAQGLTAVLKAALAENYVQTAETKQKVKLSPEDREKAINEVKAKMEEKAILTRAQDRREREKAARDKQGQEAQTKWRAEQAEAKRREDEATNALNPSGKRYGVIYTDPFHFFLGGALPQDVWDFEISQFCAENSLLLMWCPDYFLKNGILLMGVWGFEYRKCIPWGVTPVRSIYALPVSRIMLLIGEIGDYLKNEENPKLAEQRFYLMPEKEKISVSEKLIYEKLPGIYEFIEALFPSVEYAEILTATKGGKGWIRLEISNGLGDFSGGVVADPVTISTAAEPEVGITAVATPANGDMQLHQQLEKQVTNCGGWRGLGEALDISRGRLWNFAKGVGKLDDEELQRIQAFFKK